MCYSFFGSSQSAKEKECVGSGPAMKSAPPMHAEWLPPEQKCHLTHKMCCHRLAEGVLEGHDPPTLFTHAKALYDCVTLLRQMFHLNTND